MQDTHDETLSFDMIMDLAKIPNRSVRDVRSTSHFEALSAALLLARSNHALGVAEVLAGEEEEEEEGGRGTAAGEEDERAAGFRLAAHHHLHAVKMIGAAQVRLQPWLLRGRLSPAGAREATNAAPPRGRRLATRARDLGAVSRNGTAVRAVARTPPLVADARVFRISQLANPHEPDVPEHDNDDDVEEFAIRCALFMAQQQACLSHACSRLGLRSLSVQWLRRASDSAHELGLTDVAEEVRAVRHLFSVIPDPAAASAGKGRPSLDLFSLYKEGSLASMFEECRDQPLLFFHLALAALGQGLHMSAMTMLQRIQKTERVYNSPSPPTYSEELLQAIDLTLIIRLKDGDTKRAVDDMRRRLDVVSLWRGSASIEVAHGRLRLGCLLSALGHHKQCVQQLEQSMHTGEAHKNYKALDCIKLLATSYDAMRETECAKRQYERALSMEDDVTTKAKIMNALAYVYTATGEQNHLAISYLEKTIHILKEDVNYLEKSLQIQTDSDFLLFETMILLGNAMSSNNSLSQATCELLHKPLCSMYYVFECLTSNSLPPLCMQTGTTWRSAPTLIRAPFIRPISEHCITKASLSCDIKMSREQSTFLKRFSAKRTRTPPNLPAEWLHYSMPLVAYILRTKILLVLSRASYNPCR